MDREGFWVSLQLVFKSLASIAVLCITRSIILAWFTTCLLGRVFGQSFVFVVHVPSSLICMQWRSQARACISTSLFRLVSRLIPFGFCQLSNQAL
jgi:hypothetical protein